MRYAPTPQFTEHMADTLREGRFRTEPGVQHILAMDLMAQEASMDVWISGWDGVLSPRDIASDAIARNRHQALVRSYGERVGVGVPALARAA
jgi:hypothetical protein